MGIDKEKSITVSELRRRAEEKLKTKSPEVGFNRTDDETQRLFHELQVHQIELEMQNEELIQAREDAETALEKYSDLFDFAPMGYFTLDRNVAISAVNLAGASLLGIERGRLLGRRFEPFVAPEYRTAFADFLAKVFISSAKEACELILLKDGNLPLFVQMEGLVATSGQECRIALIDITENKQAEMALLQSEQQFRTLADAIPQLCWMANADGWLFWYNQRWYEYTGTTPEQMTGWGWQSVHDPEVLPQVLELWKASIATGKPFDMEFPIRRSDGKFHTFLTRVMPLYGQDGKVVRWFGTNTDISEQKRVEDALANKKLKLEELNKTLELRISQGVEEMRRKDLAMIQQNSLAAMGGMINNIAHQWRQPLNVVSLIIQSVQAEYESGTLTSEGLNADIQDVMKTVQQMSQTIDDFRNFFQPDKVKLGFSISEAVTRAISLVSASLNSHNIKVEIKADDDVTVLGYQNEYSQVLLNLFSNTCDACIEHNVGHCRIFIHITRENEHSVLYFRDNCGGIPDDVIPKIFDPYFTTRGPDKGTGIGLYMSKMIIEQNMGGHLTASNVDGGAEFRIEV